MYIFKLTPGPAKCLAIETLWCFSMNDGTNVISVKDIFYTTAEVKSIHQISH